MLALAAHGGSFGRREGRDRGDSGHIDVGVMAWRLQRRQVWIGGTPRGQVPPTGPVDDVDLSGLVVRVGPGESERGDGQHDEPAVLLRQIGHVAAIVDHQIGVADQLIVQ